MDTLRFLIDLYPPTPFWLPGLASVAAFILVARFAVARDWPSAVGVAVVPTAMAVVACTALAMPPTTPGLREGLGDGRLEYVALFVGVLVFLGLAGAAFTALRARSLPFQISGTVLAGVLALPFGMLAMLYLACAFNLGCV